MGNLRVWAGTVLMLLCIPATLRAQSVPSPYRYVEKGQTASVLMGVFNPGTGRFGFGPASGTLFGGRYSLEVSGPLALDGSTTLFSSTRGVINPARSEGDRTVDEADVRLLMVDVRLRFDLTGRRTWHRLTPYFSIGGGLAFDLAGEQPGDKKLDLVDRFTYGTKLLGLFGIGSRVFLRDDVAFVLDLQRTLYKLDVPTGFRDSDLGFESVPESEWVSGNTITLGLSYIF